MDSLKLDVSFLPVTECEALVSAIEQGYLLIPPHCSSAAVEFFISYQFLRQQVAIVVGPECAGDRLVLVLVCSQEMWLYLSNIIPLLDCMDLELDEDVLTISMAFKAAVACTAAKDIWGNSKTLQLAGESRLFSIGDMQSGRFTHRCTRLVGH